MLLKLNVYIIKSIHKVNVVANFWNSAANFWNDSILGLKFGRTFHADDRLFQCIVYLGYSLEPFEPFQCIVYLGYSLEPFEQVYLRWMQ